MHARDDRMQRVDDMERIIVQRLGERGALDALTRALSYDQKADLYSYIIRMRDLEGGDSDDRAE